MAGEIYLTSAVRGLVSEGKRIDALIRELGPDAVAITVSKEGLRSMNDIKTVVSAEPANIEETVYMEGLSEFGEVVKPPPCFSAAAKAARELGIPAEALDMDDEHYTAAYCKHVSTLDMMRQGNSGKRLGRHAFSAETPEGFALEWDALVNRLEGYRALEAAREDWFVKGIVRLSAKYGKIAVIVETERFAGVKAGLAAKGIGAVLI